MSDSKEELPDAPELARQVSIGSGSAHVNESCVIDASSTFDLILLTLSQYIIQLHDIKIVLFGTYSRT